MIAYHIAYREYHHAMIRKIRIVAHCFLAIISIIYLFSRIFKEDGSFYVLMLMSFPLSWKIGIELENYLSSPSRRYLDWLASWKKSNEKSSIIFYIQD